MKRIDFENHFYDVCFYDALKKRNKPPFYREDTDLLTWTNDIVVPQGKVTPPLLEIGEGRIKLMDELGIDTAVLSCSPGVESIDAADSIEVCRKTNDALYAASQKYPGRILGSAILPVRDVAAACKELERCVKDLGFVSWQVHSNFGKDAAPDDAVFRPIFQKAADLGVYVYLHPQLPEYSRLEGYGFPLAGSGLGFTLDCVITTTRMIFSGLFDEIPNLTVLLGHLGEGFPFVLTRMDNRVGMYKNPLLKNQNNVSYYFKNNILVTTSGNMSKEAFYCTRDMLGIDRILFGSDHPYENAAEMVEFVNEIPLTDAEREAVYFRNAEEKLNIRVK